MKYLKRKNNDENNLNNEDNNISHKKMKKEEKILILQSSDKNVYKKNDKYLSKWYIILINNIIKIIKIMYLYNKNKVFN
jgi:hypothetical protein